MFSRNIWSFNKSQVYFLPNLNHSLPGHQAAQLRRSGSRLRRGKSARWIAVDAGHLASELSERANEERRGQDSWKGGSIECQGMICGTNYGSIWRLTLGWFFWAILIDKDKIKMMFWIPSPGRGIYFAVAIAGLCIWSIWGIDTNRLESRSAEIQQTVHCVYSYVTVFFTSYLQEIGFQGHRWVYLLQKCRLIQLIFSCFDELC